MLPTKRPEEFSEDLFEDEIEEFLEPGPHVLFIGRHYEKCKRVQYNKSRKRNVRIVRRTLNSRGR